MKPSSRGRSGLAVPLVEVERIDDALSRAARSGSTLRLRLGALLDAVARRGLHHEMGFSSLEAYALEWCERPSRWVQETRTVACALGALPGLRAALATGEIPWSAACLATGKASAVDEASWTIATRTLTVRQLRRLVAERTPDSACVCHGLPLEEGVSRHGGTRGDATRNDLKGGDATDKGATDAGTTDAGTTDAGRTDAGRTDGGSARIHAMDGGSAGAAALRDDDEPPMRHLTIAVDPWDASLFECARMIAGRISGAMSADDVLEALLAEASTSLPSDTLPDLADDAEWAAQRAWERQLSVWQDQAEALCEPRLSSARGHVPEISVPTRAELESLTPSELHAGVVETARELAGRDLTIGHLAERFWAADGWRRLGYGTEQQYVRERLGLRISCIKSKRALARRTTERPQVAEALEGGKIGSEAARLIAIVAGPETCDAWIARAECRTIKHLREDVAIAQRIARLDGSENPLPPSEDDVAQMRRTEAAVISGAWLSDTSGDGGDRGIDASDAAAQSQMSAASPVSAADAVAATDATDRAESAAQSQMSAQRDASDPRRQSQMSADVAGMCAALLRLAPGRGLRAGRVTLRFRVSAETHRHYRRLERAFWRTGSGGMPFIRFLCLAFIEAWKHELPCQVAYGHIYERDRFRCASPVCSRWDVTPHHLRYRSQGGDDSDENLISLCVWCHLEGIHGGRLRADPPASGARFHIGREPHTTVVGRQRTRPGIA